MVVLPHNTSRQANDRSLIAFLGIVFLYVVLEIVFGTGLGEDLRLENVQAGLLLVAAVLFCARALRAEAAYRPLHILLTAGLTFLFLEEISYGQRLFNFETPEMLGGNLQQEANLHNLPIFIWLTALVGALLTLVGVRCFRRREPVVWGRFVIVPRLSRVKWALILIVTVFFTSASLYFALLVDLEAAWNADRSDPIVKMMMMLHTGTETLETLIYVFIFHLSSSSPDNW